MTCANAHEKAGLKPSGKEPGRGCTMLVMQANVHNGKTLKYLRQIAIFFVAIDYLLIWEYPRFFGQKSAPCDLVTTTSCEHFFASEMRVRNSG
jgi:hypothetical protein